MTRVLKRKNPGPGGMLVCSILLHAAVFFLITRQGLFPDLHTKTQPVYYVDVVNLPVAHPQAGNPAANAAKVPATPAAAAVPATPPVQAMKLPVKPAPTARVKSLTSPPSRANNADQQETSREFEERMARLERDYESRHQAAALDALRKRSTGNGSQAGMPGATGTEAGSDYASYVRSRLEDAFRQEDTFRPDKNKVVEIRLTIDRSGKIIGKHVERSSGDVMFNEAVNRAIFRAEKDLRRPPSGGAFECGFVFKPQGVRKN